MPHKALQIECIAAGFQHMRSKTMSQRMNSAWFNDPCLSFVYFEHMFYPPLTEITLIPSAREQIMFGAGWLKNSPIPS